MTTSLSGRPVCIYAEAALKRNGTKLLIVMCIGLALALYGLYVTARTSSNPHYMPTITVATHWFYTSVANKLHIPGTSYWTGCGGNQKGRLLRRFPQMLWRFMVKPMTKHSGFFNGLIHIGQIALLRMHPMNLKATDAIIALSAIGFVISMVCLFGAAISCKLMCISCLGIHHMVIIYLAARRRKIVQNILCPPANVSQNCTFGISNTGSTNTGTSGTQNRTTTGRSSKSDGSSDPMRRRSTRY